MEKQVPFCKSCGARIAWVKHERTGNTAPIDSTPVPDGPITLNIGTDGHEIISYHVLSKAERAAPPTPEVPRYTNHFQSCPQAKTWHGQSIHNTRVTSAS